MGIASIVLGVLSLLFAIGGFFASVVPGLGALLSFGSPVLALIGIVLGGVGLSRARNEGGETGVPMAGLILSVVAFFPGFFIAVTCGICNSMCTAAQMRGPHNSQGAPAWSIDGGLGPSPGLGPVPVDPNAVNPNAVDPNAVNPNPVDPNAVDPNAVNPNPVNPNPVNPNPVPTDPNAPPPAFPPPPP